MLTNPNKVETLLHKIPSIILTACFDKKSIITETNKPSYKKIAIHTILNIMDAEKTDILNNEDVFQFLITSINKTIQQPYGTYLLERNNLGDVTDSLTQLIKNKCKPQNQANLDIQCKHLKNTYKPLRKKKNNKHRQNVFNSLVQAQCLNIASLPKPEHRIIASINEFKAIPQNPSHEWQLFFDGGVTKINQKYILGLGCVLKNKTTNEQFNFNAQINQLSNITDSLAAEMMALNFATSIARASKIQKISVYGDNKTVIHHIFKKNGSPKHRRLDIRILVKSILKNLSTMECQNAQWVPREANKTSDFLATLAMKKMKKNMTSSYIKVKNL